MVCGMDITPSQVVGRNLRAELVRRDQPQMWLAEKMGFTQSQLSKRLLGKIAFSVDEVHKIAGILEIPVATLLPSEVTQ